ncbi:MAG: protein meaA, partial [Rhodospirillales bacterium]
LLSLYIAAADRQGIDRKLLSGTTQNDVIKEYLSRGTYIFPPEPSMKLTTDVVAFTCREVPKWNPTNVCSYHLQEAGATPEQELSFALATAIALLEAARARDDVPAEDFPKLVGRISFFVNAGIRFVTEICKLRAFTELWDEICRDRFGVEEEKYRRFRYGVQVNSLGLTEQQPENNVYRILLEMLAVVLSKDARARAVQLPAWNEALGLPRPWDQQWSLRLQQIVAHETDLLEFGDIFAGSSEIGRKVAELKDLARAELARIDAMGGALTAIDSGYMKRALVESNRRRISAVESGDMIVVGVNAFTNSEPSPLGAGNEAIQTVDENAEHEQIERLIAWRDSRDSKQAAAALEELRRAATEGRNVMEPSIACAHAGVTTGEWGELLRDVYGEYRAPTGIGGRSDATQAAGLAAVAERVEGLAAKLGRRPKMLVGKPGLDGHSNGAEQVAVRARDAGFDVVYEGIRLTPAQIANSAVEEAVHVVGLSILSGGHIALVTDVMKRLEKLGAADIPVVVGGIIPAEDEAALLKAGVARVYTPKDFDITAIMSDIVDMLDGNDRLAA